MKDETGGEGMVVLRTEGGVWYALPAAEFERAHITDPTQTAQVRGHPFATQARMPAAFLSGEVLAAHRLSDEQAAELEATVAAAADTAGFNFKMDAWFWDHDYGIGYVAVDGVLRAAYRVPLDLVAQRGLILRHPGYGR